MPLIPGNTKLYSFIFFKRTSVSVYKVWDVYLPQVVYAVLKHAMNLFASFPSFTSSLRNGLLCVEWDIKPH